MGSELVTLHLEDCLEALIDYRGKTPRKTDAGIPLITAKVVKSGRIETLNEFIAEEDYEIWMTRGYPQIGDVVLTTEAPLGEVGQIKFLPVALAQRIVTLRGKRDLLDSTYLLYMMQSQEMQAKLVGRSSGTTVIGIKQSELRKIEVTLPPLPEQRAIAHILGTLDDKIELNRKQNETLEEMARTLFKAWFVDFEPVRAKMDGRWQRGQSLPGLPAHLYDLFPDRLVDSELGEIPEGWEHKTMSSVSDVGIGKTPPRKESQWFSENPQDVQWVSIRDMGSYGVYTNVTSEFLTEEAVRKFNIRLVPPNTVIMSFKLTLGRVAIAARELTTNEAIAHFKLPHDSKINPEYLYLHLKQFDFSSLSSTSSIADAVNSKTVRDMRVLIADEKILQAFTKLVVPWFESIRETELQSHTLAQLRDTLLPKLISGELRVPDAERLLATHL